MTSAGAGVLAKDFPSRRRVRGGLSIFMQVMFNLPLETSLNLEVQFGRETVFTVPVRPEPAAGGVVNYFRGLVRRVVARVKGALVILVGYQTEAGFFLGAEPARTAPGRPAFQLNGMSTTGGVAASHLIWA